ncbi:MAG: hypothetical protein M3Y87_30165 [Myxococcota bacterium]|nr:hypothetical protein [Myxococcota bacterium]
MPLTTLPASCPAALRELYENFGGLDLEYGWSGQIVPAAEIRTGESLAAEYGMEDPRITAKLVELDLRGFWEVDGDWLCWASTGQAHWIGVEWTSEGFLGPGRSFDDALDALYDAVARGERHHA